LERRNSTLAADPMATAAYTFAVSEFPPRTRTLPCPELNVMENVWQFMRDNWLSNRLFRDYDDIVAHCCHHCNRLVDQPWRIMSLGLRDWAREF
jgi:hypothetical protein